MFQVKPWHEPLPAVEAPWRESEDNECSASEEDHEERIGAEGEEFFDPTWEAAAEALGLRNATKRRDEDEDEEAASEDEDDDVFDDDEEEDEEEDEADLEDDTEEFDEELDEDDDEFDEDFGDDEED